MLVGGSVRAFVLGALCATLAPVALTQDAAKYKIPDVTIEAFKPKGFRASIPDAPKLNLFVFQGNVNRPIGRQDVGSLAGEVLAASGARWEYRAPGAALRVGDVVHYYVFVSVDGAGYLRDNLTHTVTELVDESAAVAGGEEPCLPTPTRVRGARACAGQLVFEERFDSLREDVWQLDHCIPVQHPEFPFISYQRGQAAVTDGELRVTARPQHELPGFTNDSIYSGHLDLFDGCTGATAEACSAQASGAAILPPVASARLTSKSFAFTYGTVAVRARLPQGDWLYPEILLEPLMRRYGSLEYASGLIKLASARGNDDLTLGDTDYSSKVLYGGPIIEGRCRGALLGRRRAARAWSDDYHVYALRWAPDLITLSVDGEEWARMEPAAGGLRARLPPACRRAAPAGPLPLPPATDSPMAPFDQYFYLSLGVAAGGISEFPGGATSRGRPKPWRDAATKAALAFWRDEPAWRASWRRPTLAVDYVTVTAL